MIYVLYGQPGSGKTTLSKRLAEHINTPYLLDGDEFRTMFNSKGRYGDKIPGYTPEGRKLNINRVNAVATYIHQQTPDTDVIIACVNPYIETRCNIAAHNPGQVRFILLTCNRDLRVCFHVNDFEPGEPDLHIDTDRHWRNNWLALKTLADKMKECK